MPELLFYFLFCASEAQILKSTLGANAAPIDNLAVPYIFFKYKRTMEGKHTWVKLNTDMTTGIYPLNSVPLHLQNEYA